MATTDIGYGLSFEALLRDHLRCTSQSDDDSAERDLEWWSRRFETHFGPVRDLIMHMNDTAKRVIGPEAGVTYEITPTLADCATLDIKITTRQGSAVRPLTLRAGSVSLGAWSSKALCYREPLRRDRHQWFVDCDDFLRALETYVAKTLLSL